MHQFTIAIRAKPGLAGNDLNLPQVVIHTHNDTGSTVQSVYPQDLMTVGVYGPNPQFAGFYGYVRVLLAQGVTVEVPGFVVEMQVLGLQGAPLNDSWFPAHA